jgi:hypothetical protein
MIFATIYYLIPELINMIPNVRIGPSHLYSRHPNLYPNLYIINISVISYIVCHMNNYCCLQIAKPRSLQVAIVYVIEEQGKLRALASMAMEWQLVVVTQLGKPAGLHKARQRIRTRLYRIRAWPLGWRGTPQKPIFVLSHEKCFFHFGVPK